MKKLILILLYIGSLTTMSAQNLTQTIRGIIVDEDTQIPLIGANIVVLNSSPTIGTSSDLDGRFRLDGIPIGRVSLQVSYLGYEDKVVPNLSINSAKEMVLDVALKESAFALEGVVISAGKGRGEPLNEMALLSARSISTEQTSRYAGGFNDPSRITSNFAGVTSTQDGGNDIIIRGNSPKYVQWQLEGVPITNPNHFADQNAVSGVLSALNNNLISTSDFYTGAFPAAFGNALSGVYDVRLRKGNNEKFEGTASLGLLGTDVTLEGPFKKGYAGSYLVNYRYSTIGIVSDIGLVDFDALLNFQDAAVKIWLPTKKMGTFSLFGLAGRSKFIFEDVDPSLWVTPGDNFMQEDITEDYQKNAHLSNVGINHIVNLSERSYLKTSLMYSNEGIADEIFEIRSDSTAEDERYLNFNSEIDKASYRASSIYNLKLNARHKIRVGANYTLSNYNVTQSRLGEESIRVPTLAFDEGIGLLNSFINWKYDISEPLSLVAGLHNSNVLYNNKNTLEPRIAFKYSLSKQSIVTIGFGNHSTMESVPNYFAQVEQPNGSFATPNENLDLLRANHYVLGYEQGLGPNLKLKVETYYQDLYKIPVENSTISSYSTLNEGLEFRYVDLVNEGKGKNYGIEITLERYLKNQFYFLLNGSIYESKYTALDGVERNTQYNGHYLVNFLIGKEFLNLGKKDNQVFAINAKVFFGGGKNIIPLLRDNNGALAVDPSQGLFYDYEQAYTKRLDDTFSAVLNFSYKWNKPKTTHELYLSFENLTPKRANLLEYYDASEPDGIGYQKQVMMFPNLLYRVYF